MSRKCGTHAPPLLYQHMSIAFPYTEFYLYLFCLQVTEMVGFIIINISMYFSNLKLLLQKKRIDLIRVLAIEIQGQPGIHTSTVCTATSSYNSRCI